LVAAVGSESASSLELRFETFISFLENGALNHLAETVKLKLAFWSKLETRTEATNGVFLMLRFSWTRVNLELARQTFIASGALVVCVR
jgi:hypothetical protein